MTDLDPVIETMIDRGTLNKVDKEDGKGLSTNDFTDELKSKLQSLENYDDTNLRTELQTLNNYVNNDITMIFRN